MEKLPICGTNTSFQGTLHVCDHRKIVQFCSNSSRECFSSSDRFPIDFTVLSPKSSSLCVETRRKLFYDFTYKINISPVLAYLSLLLIGTPILSTMATSDLATVSDGNSVFANQFYKILSRQEGNVFFSPLSAHTVLAMAYLGAAGDTATSFSTTLNVPSQLVAARGYGAILNALNSIKNVTLHIANKVFVMKDFPLKENFKQGAVTHYLSEAQEVNFAANTEAAGIINGWVEKKTNSKIKDLIAADALDSLTRLVLVNAVYFKGNWRHQFNKEFTTTEPFYINQQDKIDCQMMHITKRYNYREDESLDAKILELPYDNENVSMVIILPNARDGIKALEQKLVDVNLSTLTRDMRNVEVEVSLPKFKIETTMELKDILTELGLGVIFDANKADFSEISESPEKLYVSKVIQKAFIEVNEEGAEAAAATAMVAVACCALIAPIKKNVFVADHPFLFLLAARREETSNVLFQGRVYKV